MSARARGPYIGLCGSMLPARRCSATCVWRATAVCTECSAARGFYRMRDHDHMCLTTYGRFLGILAGDPVPK